MITGNVNKAVDAFAEDIKRELRGKDIRIEYLEKQNQELRDEKYKDNELSRMETELKTMRANYYRGFPISEEERVHIEEWMEKHDKDVHGCNNLKDRLRRGGCIGGTYKYEFVPASIGTVGTVRCSCGAEFTFQDLV